MKEIIGLKGRFYFVDISRDDKLLAGAKALSVTLLDLEKQNKIKEFQMKNCAHIYFTLNNKFVILVNTSSSLWIINLENYEIVFKKKIGKGDCYEISEYNNTILVGDWNNNHWLINLQDFSCSKLNLSFGITFANYHNQNKLIALQKDELFSDTMSIVEIDLLTLECDSIKEISALSTIFFHVYQDKIVFVEMEDFNCCLVIMSLAGDVIEKKELDFFPVSNLVVGEYICASQFFSAEIFDSNLNSLQKIEAESLSCGICFANFHSSKNIYLIKKVNFIFVILNHQRFYKYQKQQKANLTAQQVYEVSSKCVMKKQYMTQSMLERRI